MSIMNSSSAIQAVLDRAAAQTDRLAVIRVATDSDAAPAALNRRLTLPLAPDAQLAFALGCAQAGMRVVLDLTALRDAGERLEAAFAALPRASRAPLIIRICARRCPSLPGVHVIAPGNARECAGAMRFALQSEQIVLIAENPLHAYETCEVWEDDSSLFSGTMPVYEETQAETEMEAEAEAAAEVETPEEWEESNVPEESEGGEEAIMEERSEAPGRTDSPRRDWAFRSRPYDPSEITRTAALLEIPRGELIALCCAGVEKAEVVVEADSEPGETAFLPPKEAEACLWVGFDRLALCFDPRSLSSQAARALMKDTAALLELPARLILKGKA